MIISDVLDVLKSKFYLFIVIPVIMACGTAVFSYVFIPNTYTSTVPLYVWQNKNADTSYQNTTNATTQNGQTVIDQEQASRKEATGDITFNNTIAADVKTYLTSNMVTKAVMQELGLTSLGSYTITTDADNKNRSTRTFNIVVTGNDAEMVAKVANCYAHKTSEIVAKFLNLDAINILEEATPSTSPSGPPRNLYILMSVAAGLCISLVIILIISYLDSSVKSKKELERALKLPVLAQIPYIKQIKEK